MADNSTIFSNTGSDQSGNQSGNNDPNVSDDPKSNLSPELQELIGPGKKYKDEATALAALPASQAHITQIETELAELRVIAEKAQRSDELIEALSNHSSTQSDQTVEVDTDDIVGKVLKSIDVKNEEQQKAANETAAQTALIELTGSAEAATNALQNKAAELSMSVSGLRKIAQESPKGLLKLFEKEPDPVNTDSMAPMNSNVNSESFDNQTVVTQGSYAHWQQLKKEKGDKWYYSPAQSNQRIVDRERLGREKFHN